MIRQPGTEAREEFGGIIVHISLNFFFPQKQDPGYIFQPRSDIDLYTKLHFLTLRILCFELVKTLLYSNFI